MWNSLYIFRERAPTGSAHKNKQPDIFIQKCVTFVMNLWRRSVSKSHRFRYIIQWGKCEKD